MANITPDPRRIRAFESSEHFARWLAANKDSEPELFLRLYKKGSGVPSITYAEALDVALCWGWIDGLKKAYDEASFLQRFTPRRSKSVWSKINCEHVERLITAGKMRPAGLVHVEAAKVDGRWAAAYAGSATMDMPEDLMQAITAEPRALATFKTLDRANRYALAFRVQNLKTAAGRAKKIASFVAMLEEGKTIHPMKKAQK
jgi:uncharacterized protein YdeI (YjbR/CyaY-like superfamily)